MMEEDNSFKLCVLCCYSYRVVDGSAANSTNRDGMQSPRKSRFVTKQFQNDSSTVLARFYKDVLVTDGGKGDGGGGGCGKKKGQDEPVKANNVGRNKSGENPKLLMSEESSENLSVCSECLSMIDKVSDARSKAVEVENGVVKLQQRILLQMRKLKKRMGQVYVELRKVEEVMQNGDIRCLESMAENTIRAGGETDINEVITFRENILSVSKSLASYQSELSEKLPNTEVGSGPEMNRFVLEGSEGLHVNIKIELPDEAVQNEDEVDLFPVPSTSVQQPSFRPRNEVVDSVPSPESDAGNMDINSNDEFVGADLSNNDEDQEYVEPAVKKRKVGNKRQIKIIAKKAISRERKNKMHNNTPGPKAPGRWAANLDVSGMSSWRREIIARVNRKLKKRSTKAHSDDDEDNKDDDPRKQFIMEYNPSTGFLAIGDIQDLIINDEEKSLQCSRCPFQCSEPMKFSNPAETTLFTHVIGFHLDGFVCKICGQQFKGWKPYNIHKRVHTNPDSLKCDKCGKQLKTAESLKVHQWVHMTPEEKAEAMRAGKLSNKWKKDTNRRFQCPTCGKSFSAKSNLNTHEQGYHSGKKNHVCAKCGAAFGYYNSYYTHIRTVCFDGEPPSRECEICVAANPEKEKTIYRSYQQLRTHILRSHKPPSERSFPCEICSRIFNTRKGLAKHTKKHKAIARPHVCRFGCGADFAEKYRVVRHESTCKGPGSKPRIRKGDRLSELKPEEAKLKQSKKQ